MIRRVGPSVWGGYDKLLKFLVDLRQVIAYI